ncbi:MAG: inorganic diphosphatase [Cocleimonas sp.]
MIIDKIEIGENKPEVINVIIEIPAESSPVKYEIVKESGALVVDRFMSAPIFYPANYGFIPHTLADDGDPMDVLVVTPTPLVHNCVIPARPIGILNMSDEAGQDSKVLAVPAHGLHSSSDYIQSYTDLPPLLLEQIEHFFEYYKVLDKDKWVKLDGWADAVAAKQAIMDSIDLYNK